MMITRPLNEKRGCTRTKICFVNTNASREAETAGLMRLTGDVTKMLQSYVVNIKSFMNDTVTSIKDLLKFDFAKDSRLDRLISKPTTFHSARSVSMFLLA